MKKLIPLLLLIIVVGLFFFYKSGPKNEETLIEKPIVLEKVSSQKKAAQVVAVAKTKVEKGPNQKQAETIEEQSLAKLGNLFLDTIQQSRTSEELKSILEDMRLDPIMSKDSNPHTGTMAMIRTKSTLPGTRYFHAQFVEGEDGESFLQHMSFEFKPGPDAMATVVQKMISQFKLKPQPDFRKVGFVSWNIEGGRILWVQRMEQADLEDNPFNAYTEKDIGTIRVAIELEIHDGAMDGHIEQ